MKDIGRVGALAEASPVSRRGSLAVSGQRGLTFTRSFFCLFAATMCSAVPAPGRLQPRTSSKSQTQAPAPQKEESLADAARRARAQKSMRGLGKVYTSEDLSSLPHAGVSVVGGDAVAGANSPVRLDSISRKPEQGAEGFWRERANTLKITMADVDAKIQRVNQNIANANGNGYAIRIADLDLSLPDLVQQRQKLQKQIDALEEAGRKAGAEPGWFR